MSRFFNQDYQSMAPYVPGEQPQREEWIKLNTNESPYPPTRDIYGQSLSVEDLNLYPDPESTDLTGELAKTYGLDKEQIIVGNGSDELLAFAFMAFQNSEKTFVFPDLTYGFYPVYAKLFGCNAKTIPLQDDWSVNYADYLDASGTVLIANPNAPTGLAISLKEIEKILKGNKENVVIIDEAYIDFGASSAISLIGEYDNLLVVQTFSKSRSLAGARVGFAMGNEELIADMKRIQYSFNPYNLNRWSEQAALAALKDPDYFRECCEKTIIIREKTVGSLNALGFQVLPSLANFIFVKPVGISGEELYNRLREEKILVRHFHGNRTGNFVRITIGSEEDMKTLIGAVKKILVKEVEAK
jgi:histidinol-phosphate aminotransferase